MAEYTEALKQHAVVTLAAALVTSRGSKTLQESRAALEDAKHLLNPKPYDKEYRAWQISRGEKAFTDEEVKVANEQRSKNLTVAVRTLAGRIPGAQ